MISMQNLKVCDAATWGVDGEGKPDYKNAKKVILLFNQTKISEEEVELLLITDAWESDKRVVAITEEQLARLKNEEA